MTDAFDDFINEKRSAREAMREEIQDAYEQGIIDEETYEAEMEYWAVLEEEDLYDAYEDWERFRDTGMSP